MADPAALTPSMTAQQAVDSHHNHLWDVVALLDAAAQRLEEDAPSFTEDPVSHDKTHNTARLIHMAKERVQAAADAFANIGPTKELRHA